MRFTPRSRLLVATLALLAGACSDSPTGPETPPTLDEALAEISLSDLPVGGMGMSVGVPSALTPSGCTYSAAVQSFVCAPVTVQGITVKQGYTLLSAAGTPQPAFDPASTAAVRATTQAAGTMTDAEVTFMLDLQQTMTLSGLQTRTHVLDGTQAVKLTYAFARPLGGMDTLKTTVDTRIEGLVMPGRSFTNRYPRAGTITMTISDEELGGTLVMRMEFNGSSKVAVTITSGGITERCTIDLAATGPSASTCFDF